MSNPEEKIQWEISQDERAIECPYCNKLFIPEEEDLK